MEQVAMDESFISKRLEADVSRYENTYTSLIEEAAETFNTAYKGNKEWSIHDTVGLGQYLESWEKYAQMFEEDLTTRDQLGDYLKVGLGLAAVQYVSMPANFLASVQPMADESGLIYFRELVATQTRGNITAGDIIGSESGKLSHDLDTYYSEMLTVTATINASDSYNMGGVLSVPVRPRIMKVTIVVATGADAGTYAGLDDGSGIIMGNWPTAAGAQCGTIDYDVGTIAINLNGATCATGTISVEYYQNLAQATDIPGFTYRLTSKTIRANYYILTTQYSSLSEYAVRRRFGAAMADDIVTSAVTQINAAVLSSMIRKLKASAISTGTVQWDGSAPTGVPLSMHRQTFTDAIEAAAQLIDAATGRGAISFIVAGSFTRRVLATLGVEMVRKPLPGPYLCGFFQGIPVFYAPQDLVDNDECLVGYRGASWFEAPIVYAPWLPVVVVKGQGSNVFNRVNGVAHAAGVETLIPGFCSRIQIV